MRQDLHWMRGPNQRAECVLLTTSGGLVGRTTTIIWYTCVGIPTIPTAACTRHAEVHTDVAREFQSVILIETR